MNKAKEILYKHAETNGCKWVLSRNPFLKQAVLNAINEALTIHGVSNRTLEDIKPTGYKCMRCGRDKFTSKQPHNCDAGFRKRNIIWRHTFD